MTSVDDVEANLAVARAAFADHRWAEARAAYLSLRSQGPLAARDMDALAESAWWEGAIDESLSAYEEAYRLYLHGDDPVPRQAAMLAMDIGFSWFLRGEESMGSGWISRAQRLLEDLPECVEHGYLQSMEIDAAIAEARYDDAVALARSVEAIAERFEDETLCAYALVGEGIALVKQGRVHDGLRVLDEAMLPVVAGRVRAAYAGNIYCQLMTVCHELSDLRRAEQWTDATARWCEGFSDAVMFLGICRVHRAQLLQVRGRWEQAESEIRLVCDELASMNVIAVGLALYELGEVRRLRGDLTGAEEAYANAYQHGCDPQPGLALLRHAQGQHAEALQQLRAAESAAVGRLARTQLWAALVEVATASGDLTAADRARDELERAAQTYGSSGLTAAAVLARGQVELARGNAEKAIASLREARHQWQRLDAPVRVAHAQALLAHAHDLLGDAEAAARERAAAAETHTRLGIVEQTDNTAARRLPDGITPREADVLGLVARGLSNREVAESLVLSERTVARHLANLYTKLGVSSRTAAAAYAHANDLLAEPPT